MSCEKSRKKLHVLREVDSLINKLSRYAPSNEVVFKIKSYIHGQSEIRKRKEFGPVLDMDELVNFLRVSKEIIEQYLNDIPCFELGGKILFRRKSIEEWIEKRERDFGFQMLESDLNKVLLSRDFKQGGGKWKI